MQVQYTASEKIRHILRRKKITIADLAEKIGTSRQNLTNKLSRNNLSENELQQIAIALNCKLDILFTSNETNETW